MLSRLQQRIAVGINALGNAIIARFSEAPNVVIDLGTTNLLAHGVLLIQQDQQQIQPQREGFILSRLQQRIAVGINALGNAIVARFSEAPNVGFIDLGTTNLQAHGVLLIQQDQQQTQPQPRLAHSIKNELAIKSEEMTAKKYCSGGTQSLFWKTAKELAKNVPADQLVDLNLPDDVAFVVKSASVFIK